MKRNAGKLDLALTFHYRENPSARPLDEETLRFLCWVQLPLPVALLFVSNEPSFPANSILVQPLPDEAVKQGLPLSFSSSGCNVFPWPHLRLRVFGVWFYCVLRGESCLLTGSCRVKLVPRLSHLGLRPRCLLKWEVSGGWVLLKY